MKFATSGKGPTLAAVAVLAAVVVWLVYRYTSGKALVTLAPAAGGVPLATAEPAAPPPAAPGPVLGVALGEPSSNAPPAPLPSTSTFDDTPPPPLESQLAAGPAPVTPF